MSAKLVQLQVHADVPSLTYQQLAHTLRVRVRVWELEVVLREVAIADGDTEGFLDIAALHSVKARRW